MIEHNLALIKKKWGMTNKTLGKLIGATEDQMYYYGAIDKTRPSVEVMIKLQDYTGINIKDLWLKELTPGDFPIGPIDQSEKRPDPKFDKRDELEARIKRLEEEFEQYKKEK